MGDRRFTWKEKKLGKIDCNVVRQMMKILNAAVCMSSDKMLLLLKEYAQYKKNRSLLSVSLYTTFAKRLAAISDLPQPQR